VLLAEAVIGERGLMAMMRARQEYRAEAQLLEAARLEHLRLKEEVRRLRQDPAAIEDLARRELGLIKPGEKLFTIRDLPPAPPAR
jgi:cell division protein FtsB